jgi:hypothetical protein
MATPEDFFDGHPLGLAILEGVRSILDRFGPYDVRVSKSQIAFRRRRGFAYLWVPSQYLAKTDAEAVLSIALDRRDPSPRFKEVVNSAPGHWMHHVELNGLDDLDDEVEAWLREAADLAV